MLILSGAEVDLSILNEGFKTAAECIEAAVRRGEMRNDRGFHLTIAAAAFHLGQYGARSFSLLAEQTGKLNLVNAELLLVALMQRRLDELQRLCRDWLNDPQRSDEGVAGSLESEDEDFDVADPAYIASNRVFHRSIAIFEFALRTGDVVSVEAAIAMLDRCVEAAGELNHVPLWWITTLARHLIDDLWDRSLHQRCPQTPDDGCWPELRRNVIELIGQRSIAEVDL